ncbi:MAG: hypothetical protein DWQ02_00185 [Bacteroidetes bacterium]|nr:MAG: hypothetical protein DWQ02_00185 [Bacteroidota bacterium]
MIINGILPKLKKCKALTNQPVVTPASASISVSKSASTSTSTSTSMSTSASTSTSKSKASIFNAPRITLNQYTNANSNKIV